MRICFHCKAEVSGRERVPFKELCPKCEAFLHCCRNCRLYSANAHNHCLSPSTEYVPDVERGNYCEEFNFRETVVEEEQPKGRGGNSKRKQERETPSESRSGLSARERFDKLFKD